MRLSRNPIARTVPLALLALLLSLSGCSRSRTDAPTKDPVVVDAAPLKEDAKATTKGLSLTDRAAAKVKEIGQAEKLGARLRVRVVGNDGGFLYDLYFDDERSPADTSFTSKGVELVVDPLSLQYLDGTVIDYVEGKVGSGFKFDNPNVTH